MDPKIVLEFVSSSIKVVKDLSGLELYRNKTSIKKQKKISKSVAVLIEFKEDIKGYIIFEFDRGLSVKMVDNMVKEVYGKSIENMSNEEFKELFRDVIGEIANQISGNAISSLYNSGVKIQISPPLVLINKDGTLLSHKQYVEAILDTIYGSMAISILFDEFLDINSIK
ncbi:MAG: chemotaxis protein CheX [Brevinematales bacterium]|nr:chemotaxis protein CheX [Brevinematales bacterium]